MKLVTHSSVVFSLTARKFNHIVYHKFLAIVEEQLLLLCCLFIELFPVLDQISFLGTDHLTSREGGMFSEFLSYNLMLNSGEKKNSNSRVIRKKNSERNKKKHILPLQVKWSVPYLVKKLCKNQFQLEN